MRMRAWPVFALAFLILSFSSAALIHAQKRSLPYFASISATKARMRTGPGREFPASWLYQRAELPVKVIAIYKDWRKVEDPDGTQGWMLANLLSDRRTAIVMGSEAQMLADPRFDAKLSWRVAPGVVGRISRCNHGWCWLDVRGRSGYVEANRLWGVAPDEVLR